MPAARSAVPHRLLGAPGLACAALALAACAAAPIRQASRDVEFPAPQASFEVEGRLSARHGGEAFTGSFRWQRRGGSDELEFASPLGQTVAVLSGDVRGVRMQAADGRVSSAGDWIALTEQGLGWRLPVDGLAYWIQGVPRSDAPYVVERGDGGRVELLRQDGWTIVYLAYASGEDAASRPSRMTLSYPEVELRLAVDAWR